MRINLDSSVRDLGLQQRTEGALMTAGVESVRHLIRLKSEELTNIRNFGQKCLADVNAALAADRLRLRIELWNE